MKKYIIPLLLSISFATPTYACGCLPLDDEPPTKYIPFTITSVKDGIYAATGFGIKKQQITFANTLITDGKEFTKGDIVLIEETNDDQGKMLGAELFIPQEIAEASF